MKFEWEKIHQSYSGSSNTERAKVFGGWLILQGFGNGVKDGFNISITFMPDKDHEWEIEKD